MLNWDFAAAFLWTVFITVLSLINTSSLEGIDVIEFSGKDKMVHITFYFIFTITWFRYFKSLQGDSSKIRLLAFFLAVAYGGMIEIVQYLFTSVRSPDFLDALANTAGSALAILVIWLYKKIKE